MKYVIDIPQGLKIDFENESWTALSCMEMKDALVNGTSLDDVLKNIDIGISASTGTDDYMVGFRNGMKWVKSLFDGKNPDYDSCISGKEQE